MSKVVLSLSLITALWVGGCAEVRPFRPSIRPIVKIGLIAPFEGLYRESGYASLEAMRRALAECAPPGMDVLPLALDDSGDPAQARRASQKLLADPQVVAIVGPLLLDAIPAVATVITPNATIPWYVPAFSAPQDAYVYDAASANAWLEAQVDYVASQASATRVLLLGLPAAWQLAIEPGVATLVVDDLDSARAVLAEGDALLWLGRPDTGARWLAALRPDNPESQFWLAPQAGVEIFALHSADHSHVYSLFWIPSDYNVSLQPDDSAIPPTDALRYSTYRATCAALHDLHRQGLHGQEPVAREAAESVRWQLQSQPVEQPRIP